MHDPWKHPGKTSMMFLFAYIASLSDEPKKDWPVQLMHRTEAAFVIVACACLVLAIVIRAKGVKTGVGDLIAGTGGAGAGLGLVMPFELAPFFFGARGEIMMATIALILVYPLAIFLFFLLFRKVMHAGNQGARSRQAG